ncbi:uncharacterized protein TRIADDRAFT_25655, partial [Trichoplax adhaerens]
SKLAVFSLLFLFSLLLSFRLDETIEWSYWVVFFPLWLWKTLAIVGAMTGIAVWCKQPNHSAEDRVLFKSMLISFFFIMDLFAFELMLCANLSGAEIPFRIVFIPLFLISPLGILACIWAFRNERSIEFETLVVINILQYIFLALQLDGIIDWHWVHVFIPLWIVLGMFGLVIIYYIIWSIIYLRSGSMGDEQRKYYVYSSMLATVAWASLLAFQILLSGRLDKRNKFYFSAVLAPLNITLLTIVFSSFGQKGGNPWWFGLKENPWEILLNKCPCLQEYGNVKFTLGWRTSREEQSDDRPQRQKKQQKENLSSIGKCVVAEVKLDMPD